MSRLIVRSVAVSLDGFSAGAAQDLNNPLGVDGLALMEWFFHTQVWCRMHGQPIPTEASPIDERFAGLGFQRIGAWILGRNMFGPIRGPWPDEAWRGWWGEEPPYHTPVFVLTHHARPSLRMAGGTEFHFVTEGIQVALERARAAAGSLDVRLGGGVATIREYLQARLIDELHLAVRPVLLGRGEALFAGLDLRALGYRCTESVNGERALHVMLGLESARVILNREPRIHPIPLLELRPTQITVGMREVDAKRKAWREHPDRKKSDFLGRHLIPVIYGPKQRYYVIDHHHLALALHREGVEKVVVTVLADLQQLPREAFWTYLDNRGWLHPFDAQGRRRSYTRLPRRITEMLDDPYRSLAGELRLRGGFAKDTTPFSEFLWADFLRRRIELRLIERQFSKALSRSVQLAKGDDASYLPGWCGPSDR